jgi:hypothetical protein
MVMLETHKNGGGGSASPQGSRSGSPAAYRRFAAVPNRKSSTCFFLLRAFL